MFNACITLTDAPYLPATDTYQMYDCYAGMFAGCTNLSSINVDFTEWTYYNVGSDKAYNTAGWTDGVAANGTFTKPTSLSTVYNHMSGIFYKRDFIP